MSARNTTVENKQGHKMDELEIRTTPAEVASKDFVSKETSYIRADVSEKMSSQTKSSFYLGITLLLAIIGMGAFHYQTIDTKITNLRADTNKLRADTNKLRADTNQLRAETTRRFDELQSSNARILEILSEMKKERVSVTD